MIDTERKRSLKKVIAGIMALMIVAMPLPEQDMGLPDLGFGIVASAEAVSVTEGNFLLSGDDLQAGVDYTYSDHVLTILSDKAVTISGTTVTDRIEVAYGKDAKITLAGVSITSTSNAAFKIADDSTGNVTVTLVGDNTLTSAGTHAGLEKNGTNGSLEIKGVGKLTATGKGDLNNQDGGAGIGGGNGCEAAHITISNGTVIATGGGWAAGIGGGGKAKGSYITISGGTVTAQGGAKAEGIGNGYTVNENDHFVITGGSVKQTGDYDCSPIPMFINADGENVRPLVIKNPEGKPVKIDGVSYSPSNHIAADGDTNLYAYCTETWHTVEIDGNIEFYDYNFGNSKFEKIGTNLLITADSGSLTYGTDYNYVGGALTVHTDKAVTIRNADGVTSTSDRIVVEKDKNANITLAGVNIESGDYDAAFDIEAYGTTVSTGNVTITLADGTENTLKGGYSCAGLQKNGSGDGIGKLTIQGGTYGTGKLTATGGQGSAGIGGGYGGDGSNIEISGGTVTANGGDNGAGIGGGNLKSGSYITISGGTVTANGGTNGAGIGGGKGGEGSIIKISSGSVKAVAGTNANAIGGGEGQNAVIPTSDGTTSVYLLTIANPDGADVFIDNSQTPYKPANHSAADTNDTNLYVYLPAESSSGEIITHNVVLGEPSENNPGTDYKFSTTKNKFLPVPKASEFSFTAPAAPITYDGSDKEATVTGTTGTGTVTVKYYLVDENGSETLLTGNNKPVNVGKYKVKIDVDEGDSYAGAENLTADDWTFTITQKALTKADLEFVDTTITKTYDGTAASTAQVRIKAGVVGTAPVVISGTSVYDSKDVKDATKVTFTPTAITSGNYTLASAETIEHAASITPKPITPAVEVTGTYTYNNGNAIVPTFTVKNGSDVLTYPADYDYELSNNKNAGNTAKITVKPAENGNYTFTNVDKMFTIGKAAPTVTPPTATAITYGQTLEKSTLTTGWTWSDISQKPEAGSSSFEAYCTISEADDNNYNYSTLSGYTYDASARKLKRNVSVTVSQKVLTKADLEFVDTTITKTYDGTAASTAQVRIKAGVVGTAPVVISGTSVYDSKDVKDATKVTFTPTAITSGNYTLASAETIEHAASITPKPITPAVEVTGTYTYNNGNAIVPTFTVKNGSDVLTYPADYDYELSNNKNAGNTAKITVKPAENGNYTFTNVDKMFTIGKAAPTVTPPTATAITYGQSLSASTLSDTNWSWVDGATVPTVLNSGYSAKITVDDSNYDYTNVDGYNSSTHTVTRTIALTVRQAAPTVTPPTATAITYGDTLAQSILTTGWTWADDTTIKPDVNNSGYTACKIVTDHDNYDYSSLTGFDYDETTHKLSCTVAVTVRQAAPPEITVPTATAITYGQALSASTLSDTNWSWVDGATIPAVHNEGYPAKITVDDINYDYTNVDGYNSSTHTVTRVISVTVNAISPTDATAAAQIFTKGMASTAFTAPVFKGIDGNELVGTIRYSYNAQTYNSTEALTAALDMLEGGITGTVAYEFTPESTNYTSPASGTISFEVIDAVLTDVEMNTLPAKLSYAYGESLDISGGTIKSTYNNGDTAVIPLTAEMVSGFDSTAAGTKTLTVSYGGKTATFDITVAKAEITAIEVLALPAKRSYFIGETLDVTGGRIKASYEDGTSDIVDLTAAMVSGFDSAAAGTKTLTVSYGGKTATFDITVAKAEITAIEMSALPAKRNYFIGETLDVTGGSIKVTYEDGKNNIVDLTVDMVSGFDSTAAGTMTLTVSYGGMTAGFNVVVNESEPEPTKYAIEINGKVTVDNPSAAAGETVNVRTDFGYDIIVTDANGKKIAQITEQGSFIMPACKVYVNVVQNDTFALMSNAWNNSYVYSYDSDMNKIKVNSTKSRGVIVVNLGEEYAGKSFTLYSGRKSTGVKITEGVLNSKGAYRLEVPDGKNYTLVVED